MDQCEIEICRRDFRVLKISRVGIPIDWSGELRFAGFGGGRVPTGELKAALKQELERHQPSSLEESEESVTFTAGPLRFVANFNVLAPINRGVIRIDQAANDLVLRYELSFLHVVVIASLILGTIFCAEVFVVQDFTAKEAGVVVSGLWLWLCGGNIALGIHRFRALLRYALIPPLARANQTASSQTA